jgi:hypothetical protein
MAVKYRYKAMRCGLANAGRGTFQGADRIHSALRRCRMDALLYVYPDRSENVRECILMIGFQCLFWQTDGGKDEKFLFTGRCSIAVKGYYRISAASAHRGKGKADTVGQAL